MKKKLGTVLDEELALKAKQAALSQKQSFSQLLENALKLYLHTLERKEGRKPKNVARTTRGAMAVPQAVLKTVMKEEGVYEAESH